MPRFSYMVLAPAHCLLKDSSTRSPDLCRAIAWDAPGYGGSDDHPQATPSDTDYAADVLALLDALNIDEVVLCGHSLGGLIATACVALAPRANQARRVVILCQRKRHAGGRTTTRAAPDRLDAMMTLGPAEHARQRAPRMLSPTTDVATAAKVENIMARLRPTGYTQACHVLGNGNAFDNLRKWPKLWASNLGRRRRGRCDYTS